MMNFLNVLKNQLIMLSWNELDHGVVVPLNTYWNDIGSWDKLCEDKNKR